MKEENVWKKYEWGYQITLSGLKNGGYIQKDPIDEETFIFNPIIGTPGALVKMTLQGDDFKKIIKSWIYEEWGCSNHGFRMIVEILEE